MRLFAADAHLSARRPARAAAFFSFLGEARRAREVYLLGDIFDSWPGDDDNDDLAAAARGALSALARSGVKTRIQRGNRDFLLGRRFCRETGCILLPDLHPLECGGRRFLLAHGDLFCEDAGYLRYRALVRSPFFSFAARMLPLAARRTIAAKMRGASRETPRAASLSRAKVSAALRRNNCETLIHGHLHRAEEEEWTDGESRFFRRCLPDWETGGGWLEMDDGGGLALRRP